MKSEKTMELIVARAKALYKKGCAGERVMLKNVFGSDFFDKRPLGVWCLTKDGYAVNPSRGVPVRPRSDDLLGVGVVTEDLAFIVHPGPSVVLPWGNPDVAIDTPVLTDRNSADFETATRAIVAAHEGVKSKWCDDDCFEYVGAPAAQWCRDLPGGNWHLPTQRVLKSMSEHIGQINECLRAFDCHIVSLGYHWSSTVKKDDPRFAFGVCMYDGDVNYHRKCINFCVRAVSAFHFEDFKF